MNYHHHHKKWILGSLIISSSLYGCQAQIFNWVIGQISGLPQPSQSSIPPVLSDSNTQTQASTSTRFPSEIPVPAYPEPRPGSTIASQTASGSAAGTVDSSSEVLCPCPGDDLPTQAIPSSSEKPQVPSLIQPSPSPAGKQQIQLQTHIVDLSPDKIATPQTTAHESYDYPSVLLKAKPQGGSFLAWNDQDWNAHISQLDQQDRKIGQDIVIPKRAVLAIYAHEDSFAVLLSEPVFHQGYTTSSNQSLEIAKYSNTGSKLFNSSLIANADILDAKATVLDDWGNYQLEWSGQHYAAYVATSHNFGTREAKDIHQGDALFIVTNEGKVLSPEYRSEYIDGGYQGYGYGGWRWNVSHSFEQRLVTNGKFFAMIAKGDAYPRGLALNLQADPLNASLAEALKLQVQTPNLFPIKGELGLNYTPIALGDMVLLDDALWISFSSSEDRESYDVGLMKVNWQGQIETMKWLTQTSDSEEHSVKMARYGNGLAIAWNRFRYPSDLERKDYSQAECCEDTLIGILDASGNWRIEPEAHDVKFNFNDVLHEKKQIHVHSDKGYDRFNGGQFTTYPDGHVAWAESLDNPEVVKIHRIK